MKNWYDINKMDCKKFDSIANYDWDIEQTDRSFDPRKVNDYLSRLTQNDRNFVR